MTFTVYGLVDPRDREVFYVGCTKDVRMRMAAHYACDPAAATYRTILSMKHDGLRPEHIVFGVHADKGEARAQEKGLILTMPRLVNLEWRAFRADLSRTDPRVGLCSMWSVELGRKVTEH